MYALARRTGRTLIRFNTQSRRRNLEKIKTAGPPIQSRTKASINKTGQKLLTHKVAAGALVAVSSDKIGGGAVAGAVPCESVFAGTVRRALTSLAIRALSRIQARVSNSRKQESQTTTVKCLQSSHWRRRSTSNQTSQLRSCTLLFQTVLGRKCRAPCIDTASRRNPARSPRVRIFAA